MNANQEVTLLESELYKVVRALIPVGVKVFGARRPSSTTSDMSSFVVVRSVTEVLDRNVYGENICRVEFYVKEVGGIKDGTSMKNLKLAVMNALPLESGAYRFTYLSNLSLGLDKTGYDVDVVNINSLIL
jgi:hypothetical protein